LLSLVSLSNFHTHQLSEFSTRPAYGEIEYTKDGKNYDTPLKGEFEMLFFSFLIFMAYFDHLPLPLIF
jgi:hypothetical protein